MTCPSCTTARGNRYSGLYQSGCLSCSLRAFSRSLLAADAVRTRSTAALRDALALAHPQMPIEDALKGVWDWWRSDRQQERAQT